jgi:hypothetical protein
LTAGDALFLANEIKTNEALSILDLSDNNLGSKLGFNPECLSEGGGFRGMDMAGISALSDAISTGCDGLQSVNLLCNNMTIQSSEDLVQVMSRKKALMTLCGLSGRETELDFSSKELCPGCVALLGPELTKNRKLVSLNFSNQGYLDPEHYFPRIGPDGTEVIASVLMSYASQQSAINRIPESAFDEIPPRSNRKGATAMYKGQKVNICKAFVDGTVNITWEHPSRASLTHLNLSNTALSDFDDQFILSGGQFILSGIIALADAIKITGALTCEDGKYYHDWCLNPHFGGEKNITQFATGDTVKVRQEGGEEWVEGTVNYEHDEEPGTYEVSGEEWVPAARIQAAKWYFKYESFAPDFDGQDEDPGAPLASGTCLRCGKPKEHHQAKGSLLELDISRHFTIAAHCSDGSGEVSRKGITALLDAMRFNSTITKLNLAQTIPLGTKLNSFMQQSLRILLLHNPVLSAVNIIGNHLDSSNLLDLGPNIRSLCGIENDATEIELSGLGINDGDAALLAAELPSKTALTSLNLSNNGIGGVGAASLFNAIKNCPVQRLDISRNSIGLLALPKGWSRETDQCFNLSTFGHQYTDQEHIIDRICYKHTDGRAQFELPLGAKADGVSAFADLIKNSRTLTAVNILSNSIDTDVLNSLAPLQMAEEFVTIMHTKTNLTTLCGLRGNETAIDMKSENLSPGCAALLMNEFKTNEALSSLDLSDNSIGAEGAKHIAANLHLNVSVRAI